MPVPYLDNPPEVIPIDVGRQLFVDDFLIAHTSLERTFHAARMHPSNPVLDVPSYSGGLWYDSGEGIFKNWHNLRHGVGYATSEDGIHWEKAGCLMLRRARIWFWNMPIRGNRANTLAATPPAFGSITKSPTRIGGTNFSSPICGPTTSTTSSSRSVYSADGIHWSEPAVTSWRHVGDHTNAHYNPFRKLWVANIRYHWGSDGRCRAYLENRRSGEADVGVKRSQSGRNRAVAGS